MEYLKITPEIDVLTEAEFDMLYSGIIDVTSNLGLEIENERILKRLSDYGAKVDKNEKCAYFSKDMVEELFSENKKKKKESGFTIASNAEIYEGYFLNPETDQYESWTMEKFLNYLKVVSELKNIDNLHMLGCPVYGPVGLQPLYSRLLAWKYGFNAGGSIWNIKLCPYILKMCEVMADYNNREIKDYFKGTVYLRSPLSLGRVEAEHFLYFYDRGLPVNIGRLSSIGATAPATLAGALVENLAEQIMCEFVYQAFHGRRPFSLGLGLSVIDMNTGSFQYGRPEVPLVNMAGAHFARHLGLEFHAQCGLTDAKVPGHESASQKLNSALMTALACGRGYIAAGLLGVDEIFSPIQMILDNELISVLKRIASGFTINQETLAFDEMAGVGHGGNFLATNFTVNHFKQELWQPEIWSREMYKSWQEKGGKADLDKAKEKYKKIINGSEPESQISEKVENELKKVIKSVY